MQRCEVMHMIAEEKVYSYYPEKVARVMMEHELILPGEENAFASFVRGY
ncbi:hypothetical protein HQ533_05155 [Candidatus Woesearchaeota archaeon]|nr:hypothetical protein [Candidatus Woesearchaeota archaeon]